MTSPELRVALAPIRTYREMVASRDPGTWWRALERPAFVALLTGTLITMSTAGRVTMGLALVGALSWSFVPALQMLAGAIIIRSAPERPVSMARALELLFIGHLPWSTWLVLVFGVFTFTTLPLGLTTLVLSALIPAVWTMTIVSAFCTTVLASSVRGARLRAVAHQAIIWTFVLGYILIVSGLWPRLLAAIGR